MWVKKENRIVLNIMIENGSCVESSLLFCKIIYFRIAALIYLI